MDLCAIQIAGFTGLLEVRTIEATVFITFSCFVLIFIRYNGMILLIFKKTQNQINLFFVSLNYKKIDQRDIKMHESLLTKVALTNKNIKSLPINILLY